VYHYIEDNKCIKSLILCRAVINYIVLVACNKCWKAEWCCTRSYSCAIPERLKGVFTTRCYTNTRLPLPVVFAFYLHWNSHFLSHYSSQKSRGSKFTCQKSTLETIELALLCCALPYFEQYMSSIMFHTFTFCWCFITKHMTLSG